MYLSRTYKRKLQKIHALNPVR